MITRLSLWALAAAVAGPLSNTGAQEKPALAATFTNPIVARGADPWVVRWQGAYYFCQSRGGRGIWINQAARLEDIGRGSWARVWSPPGGQPYSREVWAPELHYLRGKWYIYVAADDGQNENHRMYVLEGSSQDPQAPFELKGRLALKPDRWAIDGTVLTMPNGQLYFIWSGWEGHENVAQNLYIAPMSDPLTISGERSCLSRPDYEWEKRGSSESLPTVNEGPQVLWHGDKLFLIYSASGSWGDDYCLGQLTWNGGDVLSPSSWVKKPVPVFSRTKDVFGPGHCSFTRSPDEREDWIVYHAARRAGSGWDRDVRIQPFTWATDGSPRFGEPIAPGVPLPVPSREPPARAKQDATITVHANQVIHPISRYLTGACIEDVNHEVYGGIDSQMIFGESFAEPAPQPPLKDFSVFGGRWTLGGDGSIQVLGSDGAKIVWDGPAFSEGEASVDVWLTESGGGNGGFILKVTDSAKGADLFNGYEVSLERPGILVLGRHRQNWEPIRRVPCDVPVNQWITLTVRMTAKTLEVLVNGKTITQYEDNDHPLETGKVGLRTWQHDVRFRTLSVFTGGVRQQIPFAVAANAAWDNGVSGMWRALCQGSATGEFSLEEQNAYSGRQSQRITFTGGSGEIGIENQGLNRWGMNFVRGKACEGFVCVRAAQPTELFVALESLDGSKVYAEKRLKVPVGDWQKLRFNLKPNTDDKTGRFAIKLKRPGSVNVGYAFLQPGTWGRFKGLPVRRDVAEGLINQGITVLRQGGCMANAPEYRWKKMIGPRELRPPYTGWWYPHSSNGWGIFDFLNFCEAAGFLAIPDVNMGETPQDMADFIEYVNGPANSIWGGERANDGHAAPYRLKYLQLGNEEQVNEDYWRKFKPIAEAIWEKDPHIILVVGDFAYGQQIADPFNFKGAAGRITSLAAHQKILQLAKRNDREVWFDVHTGTDGPRPDFGGTLSYIDALERIADGAKHRVVIFEFNAGNHSQRRALANAMAINAIERDGRLPIATSANCLQPDGQNDNDWNQGLLFLNPSQVWLQPPGYVTQLYSRQFLPLLVRSQVSSPADTLDVNAKRSVDGKVLALYVVNPSDKPVSAQLNLVGFGAKKPAAQVTELSGPLSATNTASQPDTIIPQSRQWSYSLPDGAARHEFPPHSVTVLRFE